MYCKFCTSQIRSKTPKYHDSIKTLPLAKHMKYLKKFLIKKHPRIPLIKTAYPENNYKDLNYGYNGGTTQNWDVWQKEYKFGTSGKYKYC